MTHEYIKTILDYDTNTGKLYWKEKNLETTLPTPSRTSQQICKMWNSTYAGKEALTYYQRGYRRGTINGKAYLAHRIAYFWVTGEWPDEIDHVNGDRSDNRFENLRPVDNLENGRNQKMPITNTSGHIGVLWDKRMKCWRAVIVFNGQKYFLGYHDTFEKAVEARLAKQEEFGFHPNHGRVVA